MEDVPLCCCISENDYSFELGDKAYCLIDADVDPKKNAAIAHAEKLALEQGIELIVSVPCFEYWFLCHFVYSGKKFSSSTSLITELQKYIPNYSKGLLGLYDFLKQRISDAVVNAKRIEKHNIDSGYMPHTTDFSPSTEVYLVAEELRCDR